jgi:hypothetical protein
MDRKRQQLGGVLLLSIALVSGCASGSQTDSPFDSAAFVEMTVLNRSTTAVTAFAWWRGGARVRLGEVGGGTGRTFTTPLRSDEVYLSFDVLSNRRVGRPRTPQSFVPVRAGDRIEWEINTTFQLFYRRLAPNN